MKHLKEILTKANKKLGSISIISVFFKEVDVHCTKCVLYMQGFQSGPVPGTFTRLR